jgi:hypothetical protein
MALRAKTTKGKKNAPTANIASASQEDDSPPQWMVTFLQFQEDAKKREEEFRLQQMKFFQEAKEREEAQRKDFREREEAQRKDFRELLDAAVNNREPTSTPQSDAPPANNSSSTGKAVSHPSRPSTLDVDITYSKFRAWRNAWNDYAMLQRLEKQPMEVQKADFRCCLSEAMRLHLKCAIDIPDDNTYTVDEILDRVQDYLRQKRNVALDRVAFEERKQEAGESFDDYYVAIRKLAEEGDLCGNCLEVRLTTRIMSGIRDSNVRQKLLAITPFPDLRNVINLCRSEESATKDSTALNSKITLERVKQTRYKEHKQNQNSKSTNCGRCGYKRHENIEQCPALKSDCKVCSRTGHYAKMCRTKNKSEYNKFQQAQSSTTKNVKELKIADVKVSKVSSTPKLKLHCKPVSHIGKQVSVLVTPDTGA